MPKSDLLDKHLTEQERLFVEIYFNQASRTFGNGTQCVVEVFEDQITRKDGSINYDYAAVKAYELLRTPKIYEAGMEYLNSQGFNDASVDNQHTFLINQSADLKTKMKAIDIYNKLKGRYKEDNAQKKAEVILKIDGKDIND